MGKKVNRRKRQCRVDTNGFLGRTLVHPAYIQGILSQSRIERSLSLSWFYRNAPESALSEMFVFDHALRRHNGNDISRREASAASEAVGLQAHVGQAPITTCEQNEPAFLLQPQNGENLMLLRARPLCYRWTRAFIYQETHLCWFQQRYKCGVCKRLCGKQ